MAVSRQDPRAGQRERTRSAVLAAARDLMSQGLVPSVAEAAEAAGVSRATAYRYFPTLGALVGDALTDVMPDWSEGWFDSNDGVERVQELLSRSRPLILENEALFRAAVLVTLEEWRARQAGEDLSGPPIQRGGRMVGVRSALAPLRGRLSEKELERLEAAIALFLGIETHVALQDVVGLGRRKEDEVVSWAAQALVRQALAEAEG